MSGTQSIFFSATGNDKYIRITDKGVFPESTKAPFEQKVDQPATEVGVNTDGSGKGMISIDVSWDGKEFFVRSSNMEVVRDGHYPIDNSGLPAKKKTSKEKDEAS